MYFDDLSWTDKQDITNSLATRLGSHALNPNNTGPATQAPIERAEADAAFVYGCGWATKDGDEWIIDFDSYLKYLNTM